MKNTGETKKILGSILLSAVGVVCLSAQTPQAGSKTVCNDQPAPETCGSGQGTCGSAKITYSETPGIPDGPCNGEARVRIVVEITCNGNVCTRQFDVCKGESGDLTFTCEGHEMKLDLDAGKTWGDMPKQTNGATCSSAQLACA